MDSLGSLAMVIPDRTDTFLTWIRRSDCGKPCEEGKYRFQSKTNRIFKESGFFWIHEPEDSVEQLTISHSRDVYLGKNNDSFAVKQHNWFKEGVLANTDDMNLINDTIEKIGDRHFSLFYVADVDKNKGIFKRKLLAFTSISGNIIRFRYERFTKHYDSTVTNFWSRSVDNLRSVRIKDGS